MRTRGPGDPPEEKIVAVDLETQIRVVPFLSKFDKLERLFFGAKNEATGEYFDKFIPASTDFLFFDGDEQYPYDGSRGQMLSFIDSISGAFSCGALSMQLQISGLCCPDCTSDRDFVRNDCMTCLRACRNFPLESVLYFENEGSSYDRAQSGRLYGLDVCLEKATIESIIESWGGYDLLKSDERLFHLLGSGSCYEFSNNNWQKLYIAKYKEEQVDEMKRVIKYADLDVKKLSSDKVIDAMMGSFEKGAQNLRPTRYQLHLLEASIDQLIDEIGFDLSKNREFFCRNILELSKHATQIVGVLSKSVRDVVRGAEDCWYEDIDLDLLKLVRRFTEIGDNPPIDQIMTEIQCLKSCAFSRYTWLELEAAYCLKNILAKGKKEHKQRMADSGIIASFKLHLCHPSDDVATASPLALYEFVKGGPVGHVMLVVNDDGISRLIQPKRCCKIIQELGICKSLTRILTQPIRWMTLLRAALGTYAWCSSANADFVEFDNGVDVLIHFLDIQHLVWSRQSLDTRLSITMANYDAKPQFTMPYLDSNLHKVMDSLMLTFP